MKNISGKTLFFSMLCRAFSHPLSSALLLLLSAVTAFAQTSQTITPVDGSTPPAIAGGQPAGSYALSGFETVNAFNGNLNFHLPLVTLKGRGSSSVNVGLTIERRWVMQNIVALSFSQPAFGASDITASPGNLTTPGGGYFQPYGAGALSVREVGSGITSDCQDGVSAMYTDTLTRFTFTEPDGTQHDFVDAQTGGSSIATNPSTNSIQGVPSTYCYAVANTSRGRVWVSRDSTFSTLVLDNNVTDGTSFNGAPPVPSISGNAGLGAYLYTKDGTVYRINSFGNVDWIRDRNGNRISYTYDTNPYDTNSYQRVTGITDSLGRQISISYSPIYALLPPGVVDPYDTITYPGTNGATRIIKVHYCALDPVSLGQSCPNYQGTPSQTYQALFGYQSETAPYNPEVVSFIELPDSRQYQFSYDVYGELTKAKLPTGGSYQYTYGPGDTSQPSAGGVIGTPGGPGGLQIYRRVLQRSVYLSDSQLEGTTTYQPWYTQNCSPSVPATGVMACTTVGETEQDASGNVLAATRHWFYGGANNAAAYYTADDWFSAWTEGREYQTETLNTSGSFSVMSSPAIKTETHIFEQRPCVSGEACAAQSGYEPVTSSPIDVREREADTTLQDVSPNLTSKEIYFHDQFNNVTETDEYGFNGALYRKHIVSYFPGRSIGGTYWNYLNFPPSGGGYGSFVQIRSLPAEQQTFDASNNEIARQTFDYDNYDSFPLASEGGLTQWDSSVPSPRGNATTKSAWLLSSNRPLSTNYQFDVAGNVTGVTDPRGNTTTVAYSNTFTNAFPTQVTFPLGNQFYVQTNYDFSTGKPTSFTDMNGNTTNYKYNDVLDRLTEADLPDGGLTIFGYCDAGSNQGCPSSSPLNSITKSVKQNSCSQTNSIVTDSIYDGLGRTTKAHTYENSGAIVVQTLYDGLGRSYMVSTPMRLENPTDFVTTLYDPLGRVQSITQPDGAVSTSVWAGSTLTTIDPAGVGKVMLHDAFDRVVSVTEDPYGSPFTTNYNYDPLDDLLGVCQGAGFDSNGNCQGSLPRSFTYDSLKRLTSATIPESGMTSYNYDDSGNLLSKQDARGHVTCYGTLSGQNCTNGYDPINRLLNKSYFSSSTDGVVAPSVNYTWDTVSKGHLTSVTSIVSTTSFVAYDPMGRVTQSAQSIGGQSYPFSYSYNLAGGLETETYPTGRSVQSCYDPAGRPLGVTGTMNGNPTNYASNVAYAPQGAIQTANLGNGLTETWTYNNRLQPTGISIGGGGNPRSGFGADLYYCPNKGASCVTNNGNLQAESLSILGVDQNFNYDNLNRLTAAAETNSSWQQSFGYDPFGNRWVPSGAMSPFTPVASTNFDSNNRLQIDGTVYDGSGNLAQIGGYTSVWDSEGRTVSSSINSATTTYGYDGDGRRVLKQSPGQTTVYIYDAIGQLAMEAASANATPPCTTCYLSQDYLGSTRLVTDASGNVIARHDYLPFGEEIPSSYGGRGDPTLMFGSQDNVNQKFTGKERDAESGLDYFGSRYYASALGRFASADPEAASASLFDPQRWDAYSYSVNNPLKFVDPDGENPLLISAGVGLVVGAAGGALFDIGNQLIQNGGHFDKINGREVLGAAVGGGISGGLAGLTLGLLPAPATLTVGYLAESAVVNGVTNVAGGAVQRQIDPTATNTWKTDFAAGAIGGALGTKYAYSKYPLVNVEKEIETKIRFSNQRSLRPQKIDKLNKLAARQQKNNTIAGAVVGTAVGNFFSNLWLDLTSGSTSSGACVEAHDKEHEHGNTGGKTCTN